MYGLVSQMQRAAVSVASNIAEGSARLHRGDFVHHLSIARGSLNELETHLEITQRLGYVRESQVSAILDLAAQVGRMLTALIRQLRH